MLTLDGNRPVEPNDLQVKDILDIDGKCPIAKSNFQVEDILEINASPNRFR
ncbi:hypothetical protein [Dendronalium sp. ChiSLP03b]|uniref:hypothetical protein n=1 Tax=Dendronalium sp. ChiSLP03b TaxID=3075381 RepID=UPI002AD51C97|nr:hypothetical protein [Dendronalium sp. ChiSLP03b]MDZ8203063.1 hypothetical protein [Dendronalium sp. ChiSLP03b]